MKNADVLAMILGLAAHTNVFAHKQYQCTPTATELQHIHMRRDHKHWLVHLAAHADADRKQYQCATTGFGSM